MVFSYIKCILRSLSASFFKLFPIKTNLIVFDNFNGRGFGCNPKYIALKLLDQNLDLVWLASDLTDNFPEGIRVVRYNSLTAWWVLSRAAVRISNVRNSKGIKKRKGQLFIQTWHASLGPKMIEKDAENSLSKEYLKDAHLNGSETDLMFTNNNFMKSVYQNSFWYKGIIFNCGIPRNKPILSPQIDYANLIKRKFGIPLSNKLCLYAPTWRTNDSFNLNLIPFQTWLDALVDRFSSTFTLLVRLHPNSSSNVAALNNSIIDVSTYDDFQELLAASDVLISDYSSSMEDWVLTGRPGFMFTPDYDDYILDRQFYYPLSERPYPICKTTSELCNFIQTYSEDVQVRAINSFKQRFGLYDDGMGDETIANVIIHYIRSGTLDLDL